MAEWRKVGAWPYEISDEGEVRNMRTGRVLKQDASQGMRRVTLSADGESARFAVSKLVANAFLGPPPKGRNLVRHFDGDEGNNRLTNVEWSDASTIAADKWLHGTEQTGERNGFAELTTERVEAVRIAYARNKAERKRAGFQQVDHGFVISLAAAEKISVSGIKAIVSGRNWRHGTMPIGAV